MGHFSYTCHLSGVPITDGDKAVLLPLFPKSHWSYDNSQESLAKYGKGNLCSNDGPNMYFDELFFPIFGTYDSYGQLENIEHDDNTKVLEEFFGLTIEQISDVITDCRRDEYEKDGQFCDSVKILKKDNEKHMMLLKTSATWYHREVYDKLAVIDSKEYFDKLDLGTHGILVALGFIFTGEDKSRDRYTKVYEKNGFKVYSDGTWLNAKNEELYNLESLKKYCAKNGVDIDDKLIIGGMYSQLYDYVLPYINNIKEFSKERELIYMLLGNEHKVRSYSYEIFERFISKEIIEEIISKEEKENENLTTFYFKKIKENGNNFLKKNIVDWFNVKQYYYPTGRFLYPIGTSAQDGDFDKVKILIETTLSVVKEIVKKYNSDEDEDDDE